MSTYTTRGCARLRRVPKLNARANTVLFVLMIIPILLLVNIYALTDELRACSRIPVATITVCGMGAPPLSTFGSFFPNARSRSGYQPLEVDRFGFAAFSCCCLDDLPDLMSKAASEFNRGTPPCESFPWKGGCRLEV